MVLCYVTCFGQWELSGSDVNRGFKYALVVCIGFLLSCWLLGKHGWQLWSQKAELGGAALKPTCLWEPSSTEEK